MGFAWVLRLNWLYTDTLTMYTIFFAYVLTLSSTQFSDAC